MPYTITIKIELDIAVETDEEAKKFLTELASSFHSNENIERIQIRAFGPTTH